MYEHSKTPGKDISTKQKDSASQQRIRFELQIFRRFHEDEGMSLLNILNNEEIIFSRVVKHDAEELYPTIQFYGIEKLKIKGVSEDSGKYD